MGVLLHISQKPPPNGLNSNFWVAKKKVHNFGRLSPGLPVFLWMVFGQAEALVVGGGYGGKTLGLFGAGGGVPIGVFSFLKREPGDLGLLWETFFPP
jgi:hypothetical protein